MKNLLSLESEIKSVTVESPRPYLAVPFVEGLQTYSSYEDMDITLEETLKILLFKWLIADGDSNSENIQKKGGTEESAPKIVILNDFGASFLYGKGRTSESYNAPPFEADDDYNPSDFLGAFRGAEGVTDSDYFVGALPRVVANDTNAKDGVVKESGLLDIRRFDFPAGPRLNFLLRQVESLTDPSHTPGNGRGILRKGMQTLIDVIGKVPFPKDFIDLVISERVHLGKTLQDQVGPLDETIPQRMLDNAILFLKEVQETHGRVTIANILTGQVTPD